MNSIRLERFSYAPDGTFGTLAFPTGETFYTVERPWLGNKPFESCIPDGLYSLAKRYSPVVKKTSGNAFSEGWEVLDVPERDYIMIHPANWPFNVQGCIGVGLTYQILNDRQGVPRNAVGSSRDAFKKVMELMDASSYWDLEIIPKLISYP